MFGRMENLKVSPPNTGVTEVCDENPLAKQETYQQTKIGSDFQTVETVKGLRNLYRSARFLGIYVPQQKKFLYFCWSFIINVVVTGYLPIGFFLGIMTLSVGKMQVGDVLTSLQACINILGCSLKIILMAYFFPKLLSCERIIRRLDKRCYTAKEMTTVKAFIRMGNRFVVSFTICYLISIFLTCITGVIFKRLPYNIYNPLIDFKASNLNFFLSVVMEMFVMIVACLQEVFSDSYAVIYVHILRTHLRILLERIGNLNKNRETALEDNFNELKKCIIDHKNIIELYHTISPVISTTIFVQFTITANIVGITLINISLFATNFASVIASCFYILAITVEILPLCYYAQCLMNESNCLADAIFHSDWVDQDVRYRKMLIFFIQRSQVTIQFRAGKLFPITLHTFLSIAKFSFSLYTLIKEMDIKEKLAG